MNLELILISIKEILKNQPIVNLFPNIKEFLDSFFDYLKDNDSNHEIHVFKIFIFYFFNIINNRYIEL